MIRTSQLFGLRDITVPRFSGAIADLLRYMIELPSQPGPLSEIGNAFESMLTGGKFFVHRDGKIDYPEMTFQLKD